MRVCANAGRHFGDENLHQIQIDDFETRNLMRRDEEIVLGRSQTEEGGVRHEVACVSSLKAQ